MFLNECWEYILPFYKLSNIIYWIFEQPDIDWIYYYIWGEINYEKEPQNKLWYKYYVRGWIIDAGKNQFPTSQA